MTVPAMATGDGAKLGCFGRIETALLVILGAGLGYGMLHVKPLHFGDEGFHAPQVWTLFVGRLEILQATTMLPTYHAILALIERVVGVHDNALLRFVNLLGSMSVPVLIWKLVAMHAPQEAGRRTVQWYFMPLLFPFFLLIHTDAWALAAVLGMMLLALRERHVAAGFAGLAAVLLRQDMVIWVGLACAFAFLGTLSLESWREEWRRNALPALARAAPLLMVIVAFLLFYVWNGGVAVGDRMHHRVGFNITNVACLLLCAWLVFMPQNLDALPRVMALLRRPTSIVLLICGFALYMATFANQHPNNAASLRFYLHNLGLDWLTRSLWIRALAFVPMAWMVLTICCTRLVQPRMHVLFLVAPLSAGLHPMIEPRYYLPALSLLHVWRPSVSPRWENVTLFIYVLATPMVMWGIASGRFFL